MAYRDDRHALGLQVSELERENAQLREEVTTLRDDIRREREETREQRRTHAGRACVSCGGSLLPVAMFAGWNTRDPLPLAVSTARFGDPGGGFTRSAQVKSLVCSSCGFIHNYIDLASVADEEPSAER